MSENFLAIPGRIKNFEKRVSSALSNIDIASDDAFKQELGRLNEEIQNLTETMEGFRYWVTRLLPWLTNQYLTSG